MSEAAKNQNTFNFHAPVGTTNAGDVTVHGDSIGIQHNYALEQNLAEAAKEIQDLLNQLAQTNPTTTEYEKQTAIVEKVHEQIKCNATIRNRLWNAFKAGGFDALKQALDYIYKNPLVSISAETNKGFLEAECKEY